jgi:hypothetical protein
MLLFRLYIPLDGKNLKDGLVFFEKKSCSSAATTDFRGTEVSVPAPCQDGEVPPKPSPSVSIAVSAISIDLTAISIAIAASYDEEGVVLPRSSGLYR